MAVTFRDFGWSGHSPGSEKVVRRRTWGATCADWSYDPQEFGQDVRIMRMLLLDAVRRWEASHIVPNVKRHPFARGGRMPFCPFVWLGSGGVGAIGGVACFVIKSSSLSLFGLSIELFYFIVHHA
ncbi:hypothetical protein [Frankia sp. AgPm24]|uniref:hypothetical protein n=1 Tax=Frankia sp. AgPm24 TaxID=631128 RepID=UPI00200C4068|nr:hypothetical protein [Frankia sp. AgPm24]